MNIWEVSTEIGTPLETNGYSKDKKRDNGGENPCDGLISGLDIA